MGDQPRGFANPCEAGVDALVEPENDAAKRTPACDGSAISDVGPLRSGSGLEGREGLAVSVLL